jgi:hypothetical protein
MALPSEGFEITSGEPVLGGLRSEHRQYYCPWCKSWVYTRPDGLDWMINLRPSVLDDHQWVVPFIETYTAEKLPWATTPARHRYETVPDASLYESLIAEFAAESPRP